MVIAGFEIQSDSPVFLSILAIHVPMGLLAVVTGIAAMLKGKGRGAHTRFGSMYFWSLGVLFLTSTGLSAMRWSEDYHLFILGAVAFSAAVIGRLARRRRWRTRIDLHIVGMGISYIVMLTAFYVDNGKNLPLWRDLPHVAYWLLPSVVGLPVIIWALGHDRRTIVYAGGTAR
ncbi:MAG: hypothetical protein WBQ86_01170 [Candidatus Binatus sp.]